MNIKYIAIAVLGLLCFEAKSQVAGNVNYQGSVRFPTTTINVPVTKSSDVTISVKGLCNVKADSYVAIFNLNQVGKTTDEVNSLIDHRINLVKNKIDSTGNKVEFFVDMLSFVPVYEIEAQKKLFSKRTYNEIPKGFEVKKNIHIKYTDPNFLNELITICSKAEIYNLVRVDLFSDSLEHKKRELMLKAYKIVEDKISNKSTLLGIDLKGMKRYVADAYQIVYPIEMYKSFQAFSNTSLNLMKQENVNMVAKSTTLYYKPVMNKEFDFVINPGVFQPVIQLSYEVKLQIERRVEKLPPAPVPRVITKVDVQKEVYLISPNGQVKELKICK